MISAPVAGIEYVSGNRRLIVASGPSPGSSPISVPTTQPIAQNMRFCSVSACSKPKARLCRSSMSVEGQLQPQPFLEQQPDCDQPGGDLDVADHGIGRPCGRGSEDEEHDA